MLIKRQSFRLSCGRRERSCATQIPPQWDGRETSYKTLHFQRIYLSHPGVHHTTRVRSPPASPRARLPGTKTLFILTNHTG